MVTSVYKITVTPGRDDAAETRSSMMNAASTADSSTANQGRSKKGADEEQGKQCVLNCEDRIATIIIHHLTVAPSHLYTASSFCARATIPVEHSDQAPTRGGTICLSNRAYDTL